MTFASGINESEWRKLSAVGCTGPPRNRGHSFKESGRSAVTISPILFPVLRLSTSPKAPSALCSQMSTTVRWKNEPRNWPLSSRNFPFRNFSGSIISSQSASLLLLAQKQKARKYFPGHNLEGTLVDLEQDKRTSPSLRPSPLGRGR